MVEIRADYLLCVNSSLFRARNNIAEFFIDRTSARPSFLDMMKSVSVDDNDFQRDRTTYLILGRSVQQVPIERLKVLRGVRCSRFPSLKHAKYLSMRARSTAATTVDISKLFYLIDNQGNLQVTNQTLFPFFSAPTAWTG